MEVVPGLSIRSVTSAVLDVLPKSFDVVSFLAQDEVAEVGDGGGDEGG